jgi:hypothetical protein
VFDTMMSLNMINNAASMKLLPEHSFDAGPISSISAADLK